jgi:hypothetical protein
MIWLILILEQLEHLAALAGLTDVAAAACHLAVAFGMFGPCQP